MPCIAQKRKTVVVEPVKENVEEKPTMEEDKENKVVKKRGRAAVQAADPPSEAKDEPMEEKNAEEIESPEEKIAREEEETTKARTKELKSMHVDLLRELVSSKGLELGKKDDMVEAVVAQEAQARADVREHAARVRAVMVSKKDELEALSAPELKDLCTAKGITGMLAKPVRVEMLLQQWQEDDGINKALAKLVRDAREVEFQGMDKVTLQTICERAGVDPYVKEIIGERILRCEVAAGRFARPVVVVLEEEAEIVPKNESVDMVEALLAREAVRKKELELKRQQEEAEEKKRNELKAMTNDALKKLLVSKGRPVHQKKDDMVEALFTIFLEEEAAAAKKSKLKSLPIEALNKLILSRGLELGKQDKMIESLLAHEAQIQDAAAVYATKFQEVLDKVRADFESKTGTELKDLCASKGLKAGANAEERVERLLEAAKESGEVDKMLASQNRDARLQELFTMSTDSLLTLCNQTGTDPLVKEVMIERLLAHEDQFGVIKLDGEPKAKKARVSRK